ncbi:MAG: aminotransferase class IV [Longispora sp.]|nr:aminotransferase class IV [Longispora sp. (in: high G+C Gram-positive bacteria)]
MNPVVVLFGQGRVPTDSPLLRADDLGAVRGDGVFETMHVRAGTPWLLDEHLQRMSISAQRLDLGLPPFEDLAELARQACAEWSATEEGALRLVCTRGSESGGNDPTVYATIGRVTEVMKSLRTAGLSVMTLNLGVSVTARESAPWLLGGVKSLSYAMNMACLREAARNGHDDVLWLSSDGYLLEGPTSTLLWRDGDQLLTTPTSTGVLAGTTARFLLDRAGQFGLTADTKLTTVEELAEAEGVWLASSVRGVVEVRAVDGTTRIPSSTTKALQALAGHLVG